MKTTPISDEDKALIIERAKNTPASQVAKAIKRNAAESMKEIGNNLLGYKPHPKQLKSRPLRPRSQIPGVWSLGAGRRKKS